MTSKKKSWVTAADVARHAGVSRSAVSRTFTPGASVSERTRNIVMTSANELGYQVNVIARTMNTGSSNFVGIVTAGFENPFRSKLLAPVVHYLALKGFMPLLINTDDPKQLEPSLRNLLSYHIAGVILTSGTPPLSLAEEYLSKKIPVTLMNRHAELPGADRICSDNEQGASLVAALFKTQGLRYIGFIGENRDNFSTSQRWHFFNQALLGQNLVSFFCPEGGYASGWEATKTLLMTTPHLEGLFCATDMLAMGCVDFINKHSEFSHVKVVGFDDIPQASFDAYQLTTIQQNTDQLAYLAVDSLLKRIQNFSRPSIQQAVPVTLIRRKTA